MQRISNKAMARQRMIDLLELARHKFASAPELSHKYAKQAKKISMKMKVPIPLPYKRLVCKGCHGFLMPGSSSRTRLKAKRLTVTCTACGRVHRFPYSKKKSKS